MQLMILFHRTVLSVKSLTVTRSPETAFYTFLGAVRLLCDCLKGGALFLNPLNTLTLLRFQALYWYGVCPENIADNGYTLLVVDCFNMYSGSSKRGKKSQIS